MVVMAGRIISRTVIGGGLDFSDGFELILNPTDVADCPNNTFVKMVILPLWPPGLNCDLALSTHLSAPSFTQLHTCTTANLLPCLPLGKYWRRNAVISFSVMIFQSILCCVLREAHSVLSCCALLSQYENSLSLKGSWLKEQMKLWRVKQKKKL